MTARRSISRFLVATFVALAATLTGVLAMFVPPLSAPNAYPGSYRATRAGADSQQLLTLTLGRTGNARLLTTFPGYSMTAAGVRVYPRVEDGTWRQSGGVARVRLTESGELIGGRVVHVRLETSETWFRISGCRLRLTRDPQRFYGTSGITYRKVDCNA